MTRKDLFSEILKKKSFLCIGLDSDIDKIPVHLKKYEDPVFEFNKQIIDSTNDLAVAYKPNLAFYESLGSKGWSALEKTVEYIRKNYSGLFLIADAKRGDIGNTSSMYAKAFFKVMNFDAVTVAPYMGEDSVTPFLGYPEKWVILLALTSNKGASDFQYHTDQSTNQRLFEKVLTISQRWGSPDNMMYVVGATKAEELKDIRKIIPDHFLLVPGIGAQGGSLEEVAKFGLNSTCGLLVNSSREILYAGNGENFAELSRNKAKSTREIMASLLNLPDLSK